MRSMEFARAKARASRELVGLGPIGLLERLEFHLSSTWEVDLVAMSPEQLAGSKGEIDGESLILKYDRTASRERKLALFAHELGHLELHKRLTDANLSIDPIAASAYGEAGPDAIARYSPRTYEETQAAAFALEFICPSANLLQAWRGSSGATLAELGGIVGCQADVVRTQLAHALHSLALGTGEQRPTSSDFTFNPQQLSAARFVGKPALVDAGPGTGKTATVIRRIRFLIEEQNADPNAILVLTFSNEAAQELRERIAYAFDGDVADAMTIATFHGFGMSLLHSHGHVVGYSEDFRLLDEDAQVEFVSALLGRVRCDRLLNIRDPFQTATSLVEHINFCKQRLIDSDTVESQWRAWKPTPEQRGAHAKAEQFIHVFREYESQKHAAQRIDFGDLIGLPLELLDEREDIRASYRTKFPWVIVDEFQDVTRATSCLLRAICGSENPPWVVGDARQAIYQFLGAAPENVRNFKLDFPDAECFDLEINYRSCEEVITAANQLATLLENPDATASSLQPRWTSGTAIASIGSLPVSVAEATTDHSEIEGVVDCVSNWIESEDVSAGDIAILARRHLDVRNTVLALTRRGIRAQASGLLTAEGAAGDLAVTLTVADAPQASIPRIAFSLGRSRFTAESINATISGLFSELHVGKAGEISPHYNDEVGSELKQIYQSSLDARNEADGFVSMTNFLFEDSCYLRRLLGGPDTAERAMALVEIVSALSLATAYRATHRGTKPSIARVGFAERLRYRLTKTLPIPIAPRPRSDAVNVMTCHASKGLEFPCVVVSGQTVPSIPEKYVWIPPSLRRPVAEEVEQANAVLFVGVTRARQAVVVSYPVRATQAGKGRLKTIVPLLARWSTGFAVPMQSWTAVGDSNVRIISGPIWGGDPPTDLKASVLDSSVCPLLTYAETFLGGRFPESSSLYPTFFSIVRRSLRLLVAKANDTDRQLTDADSLEILDAEWPPTKHAAEPHFALYRDAAARMVLGFAKAYRPVAGIKTDLDPELTLFKEGNMLGMRLDLIAHFRDAFGRVVAISFRPESFAGQAKDGSLVWSALAENKRISFVLLENTSPGVTPRVFSGEDADIYDYKWSKQKDSLPKAATALFAQHDAFARGDFSTDATRFGCDHCRVRVGCPHWIGALS